ncbi:MAG: glucosamine inositolphosphorylceramide transferase family protein [Bacteroidales bacterium]
MNKETRLKFGILCNSFYLQRWQYMVIEHLLNAGHELVVAVMAEEEAQSQIHTIQKIVKYPFSKILFRLYFRYILKPEAKTQVNGEKLFTGATLIYDPGEKVKNFHLFSDTTIEAIQNTGAHFLLRFGYGLIKGRILEATPYGVWSFHHDDPEVVRGVPSNFWEIYHGIPINGAILQRLSEKIDAGPILMQGWFPTLLHSWEGNINQAYYGTVSWPARVCNDIIHNGEEIFFRAPRPRPGKLYLAPDNTTFLKFLLKLWYYRIRYHIRELFLAEQWICGIAPCHVSTLMKRGLPISDFNWLRPSKNNEYRADISGWFNGSQLRIFYEHYNYCNPKGTIRSQTLPQDLNISASNKETTVLASASHLAFPFIFSDGQRILCIPESACKNRIELYSWDESSCRFVFLHTLLEGVKAVDTIAFRHDGRWWLFFTLKEKSNYELHAWYAPNLEGPYVPHVLNPLKTDIRSARPAGGVFNYEGRMIRPAQDCAPYSGRQIVLNEIEKLSPTAFDEKMIHELGSGGHPRYKAGMHTLNFAGPYLLVDAKRHIFILCNLINKTKEKLSKVRIFSRRVTNAYASE